MSRDLINAKEEFLMNTLGLKIIAVYISEFRYINSVEFSSFKLKPLYSNEEYESLLKFLDHDYDSGYGGQNLYGIIYCEDNTWLSRGEYDGAEWWEINHYPSLREYFDEKDVIKYERYKKIKNIEEL